MLMLGESILSLILSPVQNWSRYYFTFIIGLITVQVMQVVHFSSEMFEESHHALSRKHRPGQVRFSHPSLIIFLLCMPFSLLIALYHPSLY